MWTLIESRYLCRDCAKARAVCDVVPARHFDILDGTDCDADAGNVCAAAIPKASGHCRGVVVRQAAVDRADAAVCVLAHVEKRAQRLFVVRRNLVCAVEHVVFAPTELGAAMAGGEWRTTAHPVCAIVVGRTLVFAESRSGSAQQACYLSGCWCGRIGAAILIS